MPAAPVSWSYLRGRGTTLPLCTQHQFPARIPPMQLTGQQRHLASAVIASRNTHTRQQHQIII